MRFTMDAACGCHIGRVRRNNEDNFLFDGKCLEEENCGLKNVINFKAPVKNGIMMAVLDGMGGEDFGEAASYAAARELQQSRRKLSDHFVSKRSFLLRLTERVNQAVVRTKQMRNTERMGSTLVSVYISSRRVYVCNVGDSRAYRLRDGILMQLSRDHVETIPGMTRKKAPLTQHLGIDPAYLQIEPYIAEGDLRKGDIYLLCSDGLTDILPDPQISGVIRASQDARTCVCDLIQAALERGGVDNITVIICRIF